VDVALCAGEEGGGDQQASMVHAAELVIDGGTLSHILGTHTEQDLARVGAQVQYTRLLSGAPRFPISCSANSDSPLEHHDLHGKQQLRR